MEVGSLLQSKDVKLNKEESGNRRRHIAGVVRETFRAAFRNAAYGYGCFATAELRVRLSFETIRGMFKD